MSEEITESIARRVLEIVDAGLVKGLGTPVPGQMCVEAAVCYALGLPHSDNPSCVSPAVRRLKIRLNDSRWSSPQSRAHGLRRLAIAQLGTAGSLDEREFASRVARLAIQTCVPMALRAVAQRRAGAQRERLLSAAAVCEREPTHEHALEAAAAAAAVAAVADAAYTAAYAAAAADADDAVGAAHAAAAVADDAATYAAAAADAAAARSAVAYYAATADAVNVVLNDAAARATYDDALATFAERVVHVLCDMGAPGTAYLYLTDR